MKRSRRARTRARTWDRLARWQELESLAVQRRLTEQLAGIEELERLGEELRVPAPGIGDGELTEASSLEAELAREEARRARAAEVRARIGREREQVLRLEQVAAKHAQQALGFKKLRGD